MLRRATPAAPKSTIPFKARAASFKRWLGGYWLHYGLKMTGVGQATYSSMLPIPSCPWPFQPQQ